jgi:hypothetical protein
MALEQRRARGRTLPRQSAVTRGACQFLNPWEGRSFPLALLFPGLQMREFVIRQEGERAELKIGFDE